MKNRRILIILLAVILILNFSSFTASILTARQPMIERIDYPNWYGGEQDQELKYFGISTLWQFPDYFTGLMTICGFSLVNVLVSLFALEKVVRMK